MKSWYTAKRVMEPDFPGSLTDAASLLQEVYNRAIATKTSSFFIFKSFSNYLPHRNISSDPLLVIGADNQEFTINLI